MRERSEYIEQIAEKVIAEREELEHLRDCPVRIAYLVSDIEKTKDKKKVYADCTKVSSSYAWCCPFDFFITVYEPNTEDFNDNQMEILLTHELLHIGVDFEGVEPSFFLVPHDVEEFEIIIKKYGANWSINA